MIYPPRKMRREGQSALLSGELVKVRQNMSDEQATRGFVVSAAENTAARRKVIADFISAPQG